MTFSSLWCMCTCLLPEHSFSTNEKVILVKLQMSDIYTTPLCRVANIGKWKTGRFEEMLYCTLRVVPQKNVKIFCGAFLDTSVIDFYILFYDKCLHFLFGGDNGTSNIAHRTPKSYGLATVLYIHDNVTNCEQTITSFVSTHYKSHGCTSK